MLGNYRVAAQLAASRGVLSTTEIVSAWSRADCHDTTAPRRAVPEASISASSRYIVTFFVSEMGAPSVVRHLAVL
jgi:hypothetical protein